MYHYYNRKPIRSGSLLLEEKVSQDAESLFLQRRGKKAVPTKPCSPLSNGSDGPETESLLLKVRESSENGQDMSVKYHLLGIVRAIYKWYKDRSLATRIMLVLLALYALSSIMNTLAQVILSSMNLIYTILGILASAIIVYEFFLKGKQKNP